MTELECIVKSKQKVPAIEETAGIQKLATKLGIPVEKFYEVFDKEENMLTVINHGGTNNKEKTQNIALLTLLGYKIFFGQEEVQSKEIRRNVAENKISLGKFSICLNELTPRLLRRKGKLRSPKTAYRLTSQGEVKAKDLVNGVLDPVRTRSIHKEINATSIEHLLDNRGLWSACRTSFENEKYWDACLLAFRHLEIEIREKSELAAEDHGTDLVNKAFNPNNGILRIPFCAVRSEEEGFHLINRGIVLFHRNAKGHRVGDLDRKNAAKIICYVDYLLEVLKTAEKRN